VEGAVAACTEDIDVIEIADTSGTMRTVMMSVTGMTIATPTIVIPTPTSFQTFPLNLLVRQQLHR
jgi:hypothetical protein